MRTFIAIELPKEIKGRLAELQEGLEASGADVKWVKTENIHLTLKFLGEIDNKRLDKITAIIDSVAKDKKSYLVRIGSVGAFPKINSPRVIWVGLQEGDAETKAITEELEEKISKTGIPKEKREFSSHITIGRTRSGLNIEKLVQGLEILAADFGGETLEFPVKKITLYKSTLTSSGPIYEILKEASLQTT